MSDHDALRDNAGAWVLGALDDDEAWRFSAHLEVCASCRDEVERLRVAAAVLPLAAPPVEPPPELKARLMGIVEAEARDRRAAAEPAKPPSRWRAWLEALQARPALAAGLAALLIVAGGVVGFAVRGSGGSEAHTAVAQSSVPGAHGELVQGQGAQLRVTNMPAPRPGRVYQVWVKRPGHAPQPDAVFTVDAAGRGSVGVRGDLDGADAVMVTEEPSGGSR